MARHHWRLFFGTTACVGAWIKHHGYVTSPLCPKDTFKTSWEAESKVINEFIACVRPTTLRILITAHSVGDTTKKRNNNNNNNNNNNQHSTTFNNTSHRSTMTSCIDETTPTAPSSLSENWWSVDAGGCMIQCNALMSGKGRGRRGSASANYFLHIYYIINITIACETNVVKLAC